LEKLLYSRNSCFQFQVQIIASTYFDNRRTLYSFKMLEAMLKANSNATAVLGYLASL